MVNTTPPVLNLVGQRLQRRPVHWERPECGLSATERWVVQFSDNTSAFVKAATDADTTAWLINEGKALTVAAPEFGPNIIDWIDEEFPTLVMEDMSAGYWPAGTGEVHWREGDIDAVIATLDRLRDVHPESGLPLVPEPPMVWDEIIAHPGLAKSGLCTSKWIENHGPAIEAAGQGVIEQGRSLVHGDVRSDNLCLYPQGQVRFGDWAHAGIGHPDHDLITALPTLRLEGGPRPSSVYSDKIGLIVRHAGTNILRSIQDETSPAWLQSVLRRYAAIYLEWVSDILELPPPGTDT